ncbi:MULTISPECIES: ATP-binding protein [unclassified Adlercreutzia]|uniref:ATP-binding protein n=1 Tax=unclassified Adlercreutzia TaxID=2636013 RepID=UPI0013EA9751|nr:MULTISPECIES: AAA family ATPase [unclassified Adlercreutzia]
MDRLYEHMHRLLDEVPTSFYRYMYPQVNWDGRMLGIVGPRGVGKTTMLLQRAKELVDASRILYFTADSMYFASHTLYDTAEAFVKQGGSHLLIDEVHKYPSWSRELKAVYDAFPDLHVCFTGSSILDIEKGEADLSRRAPRYLMQGLSFREFLGMRHGIAFDAFTLDEVLEHKARIPGVKHPLPYFSEYLRSGYYPFGADPDFAIELGQVIARTLEVDIPQFAEMNTATGRKLKQLMAVVSTLVPFKPNMTSLAGKIQASRNNIEDYLIFMEKAGMIARLATGAGGLGALGKTEKVYLDNTNILYNLGGENVDVGTVRETFFFNQMRVRHRVVASALADFAIDGVTFEVGGRNKGAGQLKGAERGIVVKDDVEYGFGNVVPLWAFGLTY